MHKIAVMIFSSKPREDLGTDLPIQPQLDSNHIDAG